MKETLQGWIIPFSRRGSILTVPGFDDIRGLVGLGVSVIAIAPFHCGQIEDAKSLGKAIGRKMAKVVICCGVATDTDHLPTENFARVFLARLYGRVVGFEPCKSREGEDIYLVKGVELGNLGSCHVSSNIRIGVSTIHETRAAVGVRTVLLL